MPEPRVAIVTGASAGIGEAFADALAQRGYDLLLVARTAAALDAVAERVRSRGVRAQTVAVDLGSADAVDRVSEAAAAFGGTVELLVNNAGFGAHGGFETGAEDAARAMIRLNVESLVALTHRFVPAMLARGRGSIVNVASTAAFLPVPWMAVYGATKAFVLSFSEALAEEYRGRGVGVLALCPGATETNFFAVAGEAASAGTTRRSPQAVVATALRALDAGSTVVVDGTSNAAMVMLPRFLPRGVVRRITGRMMRGT